MADTKISQLPSATLPLSGGEFVPIVQDGQTRKSPAEGLRGLVGPQGPSGIDGIDGLNAYQVAVNNGFVGTEAQWVASLEGPQGPQGIQGARGPTGLTGPQGETGPQGLQGPQGPIGPAGDIGPTGPTGPQGATGPQGPQGPQGSTGPEGSSAYAVAVAAGAGALGHAVLKRRFLPKPQEGPQGDQQDHTAKKCARHWFKFAATMRSLLYPPAHRARLFSHVQFIQS